MIHFCNCFIKGEHTMTNYCEICGRELDPEEEFEGICKNCKNSQLSEEKDEEEYIDPGVT